MNNPVFSISRSDNNVLSVVNRSPHSAITLELFSNIFCSSSSLNDSASLDISNLVSCSLTSVISANNDSINSKPCLVVSSNFDFSILSSAIFSKNNSSALWAFCFLLLSSLIFSSSFWSSTLIFSRLWVNSTILLESSSVSLNSSSFFSFNSIFALMSTISEFLWFILNSNCLSFKITSSFTDLEFRISSITSCCWLSNRLFSFANFSIFSLILSRFCTSSSSSALCLIDELLFLLIAPPVIDPPLLMICPSSVIILFLKLILRAILLALSILSTIITSPNKWDIIFLYSLSTVIRFSAILINPSSFTTVL